MLKQEIICFRVQPEERQRLEEIALQTGQKMSAVLRALVRSARVDRVEVLRPVAATLTHEGLQDD